MNTLFTAFLSSVLLLSFGVHGAAAQETKTCEDWRCEFQARLDQDCPCEGQQNHGRYVSCVAHVVNDLVAEGLPTNCKGKLKRCAAKSICGKQQLGFSTCTTFTYGTCTDGLCENNGLSCASDTDCGVVSSECRFTRNADRCTQQGGQVNLSPTCCSTCEVPVTTTLP